LIAFVGDGWMRSRKKMKVQAVIRGVRHGRGVLAEVWDDNMTRIGNDS
jgi:hypothetical protein